LKLTGPPAEIVHDLPTAGRHYIALDWSNVCVAVASMRDSASEPVGMILPADTRSAPVGVLRVKRVATNRHNTSFQSLQF